MNTNQKEPGSGSAISSQYSAFSQRRFSYGSRELLCRRFAQISADQKWGFIGLHSSGGRVVLSALISENQRQIFGGIHERLHPRCGFHAQRAEGDWTVFAGD